MPKLHAAIIAGWVCEGRNSSAAALAANGISCKGRQQEGLDGLDRCPGSFFCGTVVPAIAASNPHIHFRYFVI
jgi:hypothetical protein